MATQWEASSITYELGQILGQGSSGHVCAAIRRDRLGLVQQPVAIKFLNSEKSVELWRNEFKSLMQVASAHCVRVYGFEWIQDRPALVLERVDGLSLADLLHRSRLTPAAVASLINQISKGLKDLHQAGLVHGDLSLTNVLINRDGQVKLVDFGWGNCSPGQKRFTPEFAAPEVLAGGDLTALSDLYGLGRLFVSCLVSCTGKVEPSWYRLAEMLCQENPEVRHFEPLAEPGVGQKELGERVNAGLSQRLIQTQSDFLALSRGKNVLRRGFARQKGLAFFLALMVSLSAGSAPEAQIQAWSGFGRVQIRSQRWMSIEWDGDEVGYAPMDWHDVPAGQHVLGWRTAHGTGRRILTVKAGDLIVIDEAFIEQKQVKLE